MPDHSITKLLPNDQKVTRHFYLFLKYKNATCVIVFQFVYFFQPIQPQMKYSPFLTCLFIVLFGCYAKGQDFEPPVDAKLEAKEDYANYEQHMIDASKWLESNQIGTLPGKRVNVNAFVMKWITGSPTVSLELQPVIVKLTDKNPDLIIVFMAGYARWSLENNHPKDHLKGYEAGIKSVLRTYALGGDVKKNKTLQKAVAADQDGKLTAWVRENYHKK